MNTLFGRRGLIQFLAVATTAAAYASSAAAEPAPQPKSVERLPSVNSSAGTSTPSAMSTTADSSHKAASPRKSAKEPSFFDPPEFVLRFPGSVVPASYEAESNVSAEMAAEMAAGDCGKKPVVDCEKACPCDNWWPDGWAWAPCCKRPGEITFKPGLRLQPRYMYDDLFHENDFFIRRFRLKASGNIFDLGTYGAELKVDSSERFNVGLDPVEEREDALDPLGNPTPVVENAWLDFTCLEDVAYLKVGLYDIPFSRNALTSDSKLLFMDRTLIFDALATKGMADNTVGVMLHGRPFGGYVEYSIGAFDNIRFDYLVRNSNDLMPAGRFALYLLDPAMSRSGTELSNGYADYKESYLGQGQRLVIAGNFAALPNIIEPFAARTFDMYAWGTDVLFNTGPFIFQAEYDWFTQDGTDGTVDVVGDGWYVQAGYIFTNCWELAARYQTLSDPINRINGFEDVQWTSLGVNYYIHEHNLKVQMDYTWKDEDGVEIDNDVVQVQLQLDF